MPLRAIVEGAGTSVIAPFLSADAWAELQRAVQSGSTRLILPCCGGGAYLRVSPRGLRHFAHLPRQTTCEIARYETLEHLAAKAEIALACRAHGYTVAIEHAAADWRADVYADKDGDRFAFEVQWSAQTLVETEERHARYRRDGARDVWFFRKLPADYQPNGDLAAFALQDAGGVCFHRATGGDLLNAEIYPLGDFVAALLNRQLVFCERVTAGTTQSLEIVFSYTAPCRRCRQPVYLYYVRNPLSDCGIELPLTPARRLELGFAPEVRAAVRHYLRDHARLRISDNGRQFNCANCGAPQPESRVLEVIERMRTGRGDEIARFRADLRFTSPPTLALPHWCFPRHGDPCCPPAH